MPSRQTPADPPSSSSSSVLLLLRHREAHRHHLLPTASGAAVVALAVLLLLLLYRRLARGGAAPTAPSPPSAKASDGSSIPTLRRFSYAQLRRATSSFSPSVKLGQGGFGPVFRATIPSSSSAGDLLLAVKVMDSGSIQGQREFQNELLLATNILPMPLSPASDGDGEAVDRRLVVPPIGYCDEEQEHRLPRGRHWWFLWRRESPSPSADDSPEILEDTASSPKVAPERKMLLVYELMRNGSLQDALLGRRCPELMDWERRFAVALDVARGLYFLHVVCDPPVIHGDIKPSNILLDAGFSAKIGDFGLSRLKSTDELPAEEDEVCIDVDVDNGTMTSEKNDLKVEVVGGCGGEDDASIMGETAESTATTTGFEENDVAVAAERSLGEEESFVLESPTTAIMSMPSPSDAGGAFDMASMDSGVDSTMPRSHIGCQKKRGTLSGKDWWWRQDNCSAGPNSESGGNVKDYVMEWIRSEIKKEQPRSDWNDVSTSAEECLPKLPSSGGKTERKKDHRRLEWWASLDEDEDKIKKKEKGRPPMKWWREEYCDELANKQKRWAMDKSKSNMEGDEEQKWWQKDDDLASPWEKRKWKKKKCLSRGSRNSLERWADDINGNFRTARSNQYYASPVVPRSGTLSSTPSMRGTVCYVAPEYGGGGTLSEKCDIYSFGVLLLVIISGRRPLQVTASPMSEFERGNLISWARQLARRGRLLDIVDSSLRDVDREQALLCITVALRCLQRSPSCRPSIEDVIEMLTGQCDPPQLPLEFLPSPTGRFLSKSRNKVRRSQARIKEEDCVRPRQSA